MKNLKEAWIAVFAFSLCIGASGQDLNLMRPKNKGNEVLTDVPGTTELTTILFSGFFLPSTAPPTITTTTSITDLPEQLETTIPNEELETRSKVVDEREKQQEQSVTHYNLRNIRKDIMKSQRLESSNSVQIELSTEKVRRNQSSVAEIGPEYEGISPFNEQPFELERLRLIEDHPCRRDCSKGGLMTCRYTFKVEWYESMSKACFNCPANLTDCYREDCIPVDGIQRPITVVNRRFPGPSIEVCLGDRVEILLENHLMSETTTVHWHGLHQRESPYMDGVPFVSQCPVLPRSQFLYRYIAANTGTHFWHSHSGVQRADGMFGSLVVRSANDAQRDLYDFDLSEHTVQLTDWCHIPTVALFTGHHHARTDNKPPTLLVNGRGVFAGVSPASFTVQQGKRYRFRLINAGILNCPIELSIDNHSMLVISSDGSDIAPIEVDSLVSYAGERWDFILKANASIGNYWMRFRGLMDCDERFTSAHTISVLHYMNSTNDLPLGPVGYSIGFRNTKQLNSLNANKSETSKINVDKLQSFLPIDRSLKPTPDRRVILSYDFNPIDNAHLYKKGVYGFYQVADRRERVLTPQFNYTSLALPPFPLLSQYKDLKRDTLCSHQDLSNCSKNYCECLNIIELKLGEVVELMLVDIGEPYDANHPFHLHGHAFRVVAMDRIGSKTTVEEVLELETKGNIHMNLVDPPLKDTVTVPDGGYTIIRFIADNPGYWMFHCHLEFHVELGMAVIFKVGEHSDFPLVPRDFPKCGDYISPPLSNENEIFWTYNSTKIPDRSFTFADWWPLKRQKNASTQIKFQIALNIVCLILVLVKNWFLH